MSPASESTWSRHGRYGIVLKTYDGLGLKLHQGPIRQIVFGKNTIRTGDLV
jgi:hypothetical protein